MFLCSYEARRKSKERSERINGITDTKSRVFAAIDSAIHAGTYITYVDMVPAEAPSIEEELLDLGYNAVHQPQLKRMLITW
jgi:hypothetical protein